MSYIQDPNDSGKQIPRGFHRLGTNTVFSRATCPAILTIQKHPDHILINNTGSYAFNYTNESAVGTKTAFTVPVLATFQSGSVHKFHSGAGQTGSAAFTPIKLDIQPVAWRRTDSLKDGYGDNVTFVYRGGK